MSIRSMSAGTATQTSNLLSTPPDYIRNHNVLYSPHAPQSPLSPQSSSHMRQLQQNPQLQQQLLPPHAPKPPSPVVSAPAFEAAPSSPQQHSTKPLTTTTATAAQLSSPGTFLSHVRQIPRSLKSLSLSLFSSGKNSKSSVKKKTSKIKPRDLFESDFNNNNNNIDGSGIWAKEYRYSAFSVSPAKPKRYSTNVDTKEYNLPTGSERKRRCSANAKKLEEADAAAIAIARSVTVVTPAHAATSAASPVTLDSKDPGCLAFLYSHAVGANAPPTEPVPIHLSTKFDRFSSSTNLKEVNTANTQASSITTNNPLALAPTLLQSPETKVSAVETELNERNVGVATFSVASQSPDTTNKPMASSLESRSVIEYPNTLNEDNQGQYRDRIEDEEDGDDDEDEDDEEEEEEKTNPGYRAWKKQRKAWTKGHGTASEPESVIQHMTESERITVYRHLVVNGRRVKKPIPLSDVLVVLRAGWLSTGLQ